MSTLNFRIITKQYVNSYFTTLIDTLHEDLNRVKTKPNKPPPDVYGKHVEDGARISWLHYFLEISLSSQTL